MFGMSKTLSKPDPIKNTEKVISSKLSVSCNLSSKQLCNECEDAEAVIWCSDCKLYFCSKDNERRKLEFLKLEKQGPTNGSIKESLGTLLMLSTSMLVFVTYAINVVIIYFAWANIE
jgi:hypothetical protein